MNRLSPRLLIAASSLALAAAVFFGWRTLAARSAWRALRPPLPAPSGAAAPGLDARLAACAARLQAWPPDHAALAEFTRLCHANGKLDAAAAGYRALIALEPRAPRWPYLLAAILSGFGRLDDAIPLLRRATGLAPDYLAARLKLGDALLKSNELPAAEAVYEEVLRRDPANPYALVGLARSDLQSGRLTAARRHLERAAAGRDDIAGAETLLPTVFERLGNTQAAAAARTRVARSGHYVEPVDPWIEDLLGDCHEPYALLTAASSAMSDGRPERARPLLERAVQLAPADARVHRQLARTLSVLGDASGARAHAERAVALAPENDVLRLDLIAVLRKNGDDVAAERAIADGLVACPRSTALRFEAGAVAAKAGRLDEAARELEFAWNSRPDQATAGLALADVYFRGGREADGVALLEAVLARWPGEDTALLMLIRHGIAVRDTRTAGWIRRAAAADAPPELVAELTQDYRRRFGASP